MIFVFSAIIIFLLADLFVSITNKIAFKNMVILYF